MARHNKNLFLAYSSLLESVVVMMGEVCGRELRDLVPFHPVGFQAPSILCCLSILTLPSSSALESSTGFFASSWQMKEMREEERS